MFDVRKITWRCEICGGTFPDAQISVAKHDFSAELRLPVGTVIRNVRHCQAKSCVAAAHDRDRWRIVVKGSEVE